MWKVLFMSNIQELREVTKNLNVLYVEDEEIIRNKTFDIFKMFFSQVDCAVDGKDGLEQFHSYKKQNGTTYDLVITDISMPQIDGIEMCQMIYDKYPEQYILVLTAYNDSQMLEKFIELGVDGFLQKPLMQDQFIARLSKIVKSISLDKEQKKNIEKIHELNKELTLINEDLEVQVEQRTKKLQEQLFVDSLTLLKTYAYFIKTEAENSFHVLFLVDINGFSKINNLYGYEFGNKVLESFAQCLRGFNKNREYLIFRISSDRFALYEANRMEKVFDYEQELYDLKYFIQNYNFTIDDIVLNLSATIGLSIGQDDPMVTADMALSGAKNNQAGIQIFNSDIDVLQQVSNNLNLREKIVSAVKNNEVFPVFHPIVDSEHNIIKYEVLMRISHDNKTLYPDEFLDIALQSKQYNSLCKILFDKTFAIMENSDKEFSLNLSYDDIYNSVILSHIEFNLQKYPEIGKRLIIEILETQPIEHQEVIDNFFEFIRKYGVKVAIDDFGTGHSNFSHILILNPKYIKIDGVFIKDIVTNKESQIIVESIVYFAKKLNIKVIAEYVHSKEVYEWIKSAGVDEFQGFYFSEPLKDIKGDK